MSIMMTMKTRRIIKKFMKNNGEDRRSCCTIDETGFHNDLTDLFDSEIIVKADFVRISTIYAEGGTLTS